MLIDLFAGFTTGLINGEVVISFNIGPFSVGYAGGSGYWTYIGNPDNSIFENVMLGISTAGFLIDLGQIGLNAGKRFCSKPAVPVPDAMSFGDDSSWSLWHRSDLPDGQRPRRNSAPAFSTGIYDSDIDLPDGSVGIDFDDVFFGQRSRSGSAAAAFMDVSSDGSVAAAVSGQRPRSGSANAAAEALAAHPNAPPPTLEPLPTRAAPAPAVVSGQRSRSGSASGSGSDAAPAVVSGQRSRSGSGSGSGSDADPINPNIRSHVIL
jgi:hypothetical protein